jgi:hypothetical protein
LGHIPVSVTKKYSETGLRVPGAMSWTKEACSALERRPYRGQS